MTRRAGINVPLFSCRTRRSWGIGEMGDLEPLARWLGASGFRDLMVLPLGTVPDGETSPYAASSTLAIDPVYISLDAVDDFMRAGGLAALSDEASRALASARASPVVRYAAVRRAKREALTLAFAHFITDEWEQLTERAAGFAGYVARERWWLDDYALFQALSDAEPGVPWWEWPEPLRERQPAALDEVRRQFAREIRRHQYGQWIAEGQWTTARAAAAAHGIAVIGDLPFVARADSPEVWARADEFLLDVSAGVPPDAFSDTGQDWGLPTYRWDVIAATGYAWFERRAARMAALFDGLRVDHVVGLYRTYGRPRVGEPFFSPPDEPAQQAQGAVVLGILKTSGLDLIAEDLGSIPDFVRESLTELEVPGCRVLRWERAWKIEGQPFLEPGTYPPLSAAMTGTHDTEPLAVWWEELALPDREACLALSALSSRGLTDPEAPWSDHLLDAMLELAYGAGSDRLFLPVQDLFGWRDRVNTPGTVGSGNWTWALPWPVEDLSERAAARAVFLRALAVRSGRLPAPDYTRARPGDRDAPT